MRHTYTWNFKSFRLKHEILKIFKISRMKNDSCDKVFSIFDVLHQRHFNQILTGRKAIAQGECHQTKVFFSKVHMRIWECDIEVDNLADASDIRITRGASILIESSRWFCFP